MTLGQMTFALIGALVLVAAFVAGLVMFAAAVNAKHKFADRTCYVIMSDAERAWLQSDNPDLGHARNRVTLEDFFALQARRMMKGRAVSFKKGCKI